MKSHVGYTVCAVFTYSSEVQYLQACLVINNTTIECQYSVIHNPHYSYPNNKFKIHTVQTTSIDIQYPYIIYMHVLTLLSTIYDVIQCTYKFGHCTFRAYEETISYQIITGRGGYQDPPPACMCHSIKGIYMKHTPSPSVCSIYYC